MITAPPSEAGAFQLTVASLSLEVAVTLVGAPGMVTGVTAALGDEADEEPCELVAMTVKV